MVTAWALLNLSDGGGGSTLRLLPRAVQELKLQPRVVMVSHFKAPGWTCDTKAFTQTSTAVKVATQSGHGISFQSTRVDM